ncbi:MAG: DUF2958 domain-containing protein [Chloroflexi bacterium]|nr:DUF2958 domain-containing protein [Chloroflexota bacterium]
MTQKLADTIPALYANEDVEDYDTVLARAKLFSPYSNWTWFITEMDPATGTCFGLVEGLERELGYFDLTELAETTVFGDVPAVERDLYWQPMTLGEIKNGSPGDSRQGEPESKGGAMTGETGTESHSPDMVSAEEFLFGGLTEETADDAPAEVAGEDADTETAAEPDADGEFHAGDTTEDAGDMETAGEADAEGDADAAESAEPDVADAGGEQPAAAETEAADELKVVLSIRGGRAVIGVQRPSADPHIESFDGLDILGLALQVPGVAERARDRWEEAPKYPAYVKPAPPARRQRQRRQAPVEAATEQGETEQEQPETLRLF